jgi:hypothetical protein
MPRRWLIILTKIGLLEVLREPNVPVLVPDVVLAEIAGFGADDPVVRALCFHPAQRASPGSTNRLDTR